MIYHIIFIICFIIAICLKFFNDVKNNIKIQKIYILINTVLVFYILLFVKNFIIVFLKLILNN
ncbi:hypothetical protein UT300019_11760 [Clostridium sp. CTA-19]